MGAENRNPYLRLFNSLSFIGECVHNSTTFQKELLKIPNILSLIILTKYMWDTENYIQLFKITIAPGRRAKNDNAITKRHLLIDFFLSRLACHFFSKQSLAGFFHWYLLDFFFFFEFYLPDSPQYQLVCPKRRNYTIFPDQFGR